MNGNGEAKNEEDEESVGEAKKAAFVADTDDEEEMAANELNGDKHRLESTRQINETIATGNFYLKNFNIF